MGSPVLFREPILLDSSFEWTGKKIGSPVILHNAMMSIVLADEHTLKRNQIKVICNYNFS